MSEKNNIVAEVNINVDEEYLKDWYIKGSKEALKHAFMAGGVAATGREIDDRDIPIANAAFEEYWEGLKDER